MDDVATNPYTLSADDVARQLRVSARRVRMISAAELPYVQLEERGRRSYRSSDVSAYIERRTKRS